MPNTINLQLYSGQGVPRSQRRQDLAEPFGAADAPEYYLAEEGLRAAVNVALALGQPLLVTGEPGVGKTQLAASLAYELELPLLPFYTKTTSLAADLFYQYDALRRFQDAHFTSVSVAAEQYITYQALGLAILLSQPPAQADPELPPEWRGRGPTRSVVLIDEIDKAPRDFPNDLLIDLEQMRFEVKETGREFKADPQYRPILVLTSNSEKNLPDPFLRRCLFYHIPFPKEHELTAILQKRFQAQPEFTPDFIQHVMQRFLEIRELALKKKPSTAELKAWVQVLGALEIDPLNLKPGQAEMLALSYAVLAKSYDDLEAVRQHFRA